MSLLISFNLKSFAGRSHEATETQALRKNFKPNARFGRDSVKFHFLKVKKSKACHCSASSKTFAHDRRLLNLDFASITCQALTCITTDGSHRLSNILRMLRNFDSQHFMGRF